MTNKATSKHIVILQAALFWAALFWALFVKFITINSEERLCNLKLAGFMILKQQKRHEFDAHFMSILSS